jgi:integral membrane sensor domain MASE1
VFEFPAAPVAAPETSVFALLREIGEGSWGRDSWNPTSLVRLASVFVLVTLCSWLGIVLSRQSEGVATIWLSNGLIFGLLITQPKRRWLAYFAAGLCARLSPHAFC